MKWPKSLIEDLHEKRCVVFIGSGISANAVNDAGERPPTWKAFLEKGAESLEKKESKDIITSIKKEDYLLACELLRKKLGRDEYNRLVHSCFDNGYHHDEIHHDIYLLDAPIYITPNFDKIFDVHVTNETGGNTTIKQYYDDNILDKIRCGKNIVLKIHGTIDTEDRMIFTKADYAKARVEHARFYRILESLILTRTFLFLGAGLNDPDIQLLLENVAFTYRNARKHYFVTPDTSKDILDVYKETMNLEFLTYNPKKGHEALRNGIKDLITEVRNLD